MKSRNAVAALAALAHEHRLAVYRLLVKQGPSGLPAGVIAERVGLAPSSLTFHLQHLMRAGLLSQTRDGRQIYYAADFTTMTELIAYLTEECCSAADGSCAEQCTPAEVAAPTKSSRRTA